MIRQAKRRAQRVSRSPSLGSQPDRTPSTPPSDFEAFQLSDSPLEDFEDDEEDREWPVDAVVGKEVLLDYQERSEYISQVEWDGWKRADGTKTTWTCTLPGANKLITSWNLRRKQENDQQAKTPEIDLAKLNKYMPHDIHTAEDAVAYDEKFKRWKGHPKHWSKWRAMDRQLRDRSITSTVPSGSSVSLKRKRLDSSTSGSRASSIKFEEDETTRSGSLASRSKRSSSSINSGSRSRTSRLQKNWDVRLRGTGSAKITVVNEFDDEEAPPVVPHFKYLESQCNYDVDVPDPSTAENRSFLFGCACTDGCNDALNCTCLVDSQCIDEYDEPSPAYDENGVFLFNNQREVVECNENCACKRRCNNNVVQRPRKVPLEIFKTRDNGWGARSPVEIMKGTVLGLYTGRVIRRNYVVQLTEAEREYSFDLDVRDDQPDLVRYSVCAYAEGNWTRFVNHSCSPNAKVYSVVYDTALALNMPYIAMVAAKDIPPRKEITIDYNPLAAREIKTETDKKKRKKKVEEGEIPCVCGSDNCRGVI